VTNFKPRHIKDLFYKVCHTP